MDANIAGALRKVRNKVRGGKFERAIFTKRTFYDVMMSSILLAGYSARNVALNHAGSAWPVRNIVSIRLRAISTGDAAAEGDGVAVAAGAGEDCAVATTGLAPNTSAAQPATRYLNMQRRLCFRKAPLQVDSLMRLFIRIKGLFDLPKPQFDLFVGSSGRVAIAF